jgi:hypothetical protein
MPVPPKFLAIQARQPAPRLAEVEPGLQILMTCCFAWNKLIDMPWKITSVDQETGISAMINETWYQPNGCRARRRTRQPFGLPQRLRFVQTFEKGSHMNEFQP